MNLAVSFVVKNWNIVAYGSAFTLFSVIVSPDGLVVNSDNLLVYKPPSLSSIFTFILFHNSL